MQGLLGALCKHQLVLSLSNGSHLPNLPVLTYTDRQVLAKLAVGDKCLDTSFFLGVQEAGPRTEELESASLTMLKDDCTSPHIDSPPIPNTPAPPHVLYSCHLNPTNLVLQKLKEYMRLVALAGNPNDSMIVATQRFSKPTRNITNQDLIADFIFFATRGKTSGKIKVQPALIARRVGISDTM